MENELITDITNDLKDTVSEKQLEKIQEILVIKFEKYQILLKPNDFEKKKETEENNKLVNTYLSAKEIEGCSQRTIKYYQEIIEKLINNLNKSIKSINTEDIRKYLSNYKELNNCNSVTIDNIRRVFSSFFSDSTFLVLYLTIPAASSKICLLSSDLLLKISSILPCPIIEYPSFPIPVSINNSNTSFSLQGTLFI